MPSSETIEMRKIKGVVGDIDDLPENNPRSSVVSRIRALLLKVSGIPQLIHLYGALKLNKTLTLDTGEDNLQTLFSDGTYLYAGLEINPGKVIKIDLSDFTKVSTLTLDAGEATITSLFSDGTYLYAGTFTGPGKVVKINLSDFTKVSTLTFGAGEDQTYKLFSDGSYLYAGMNTNPGMVIKIDLSDFTKVSTLTLDAGESQVRSLFSDGTYLYAGMNVNPGKIVKIDLETFTKVSTLTLDAGEGFVRTSVLDGTYLYVGLHGSPAKIIKIDISTFTKVSTITLDTGEDDIAGSFTDGTYIYLGLNTTPSKVIRRYIVPMSNVFEKKINLINEQVHSASHDIYPTLAGAVALTSSAVAWTQGAYTEVLPVSTIKNRFFITGIILNNMVIDSEYEVDIATGAAASEVVMVTVSHETHDTNLSCIIPISPPIKISSNTRISARCASENAAGDTCTIKLMYKL